MHAVNAREPPMTKPKLQVRELERDNVDCDDRGASSELRSIVETINCTLYGKPEYEDVA